MANVQILTNNPLAVNKYADICEFFDEPPEGVLSAARDRVHLGAKLMHRSLSGGATHSGSPYKSLVIVATTGVVDFASLRLIEGATFKGRGRLRGGRTYPGTALDDFQLIDLDLLDSAIAALPPDCCL
ncbi:GrdX family protein [Oscillospiraceae bacterium OttesenSCG-928-G22]|nr:GrdX family protein [Oscillospiraceae bacterium OttesenSCG-928-G22]